MPNEGQRVRVKKEGTSFEGIVMPSSTDDYLVIKLDDGYNMGVKREGIQVEPLEGAEKVGIEGEEEEKSEELVFDEDLPTISLISTGGTIASTVDYRTGAVSAQFDAEDVLRAVPDLAGIANYRSRVVSNILSENMTPDHWRDLAHAVYEEIDEGADGVVVMHGTDTMQYSASALSFMLDTPVPIVFVGSQRSADRPSSDNVVNAVCAVEAAKSDVAEVLVCMHANESDHVCALHRGTRVRKMHTSRRDAFRTIGGRPLGRVKYETREVEVRDEYSRRGETELGIHEGMNENVAQVKYVPGMDDSVLDFYSDCDGIVIEGTGLGHVRTDWIPKIEEMSDDTLFVMTSQCLEGRICDRVYDTGRDLLDAGVVEGEDMLPETAYVKLMWVLANSDDPRHAISEDIAGEINDQSRPWA
ncbi:MAG: Glu-tRNA(Gln) amidotransferase subunit GatD [Halobacteria archaeon]|nr:Glu-tRNA(Gln) amidotransferase subunit GatD [Halobacteria archaeon]